MLALASIRPVAVMIHGAGGGGWEYDPWRPVFEHAGWDVVAKDLQPAKAGLSKTTIDDYRRQVESWCPKDRPFVLIGASMGGALALRAIPNLKPSALVLVNAAPPDGLGEKTYPEIVKWAGGPLKETQDAMFDSDEATIRKAWKRWRNESGAVLRSLAGGYPLHRLSGPVLVVVSENDTDVPPKKSRELADALGADHFEYKRMSHVGPLLGTRAPEVAKEVELWLRNVLKKSGVNK